MVPVIRNVEAMNFADIERTISELGEKVKWKAACISGAGQVGQERQGRQGLPVRGAQDAGASLCSGGEPLRIAMAHSGRSPDTWRA